MTLESLDKLLSELINKAACSPAFIYSFIAFFVISILVCGYLDRNKK